MSIEIKLKDESKLLRGQETAGRPSSNVGDAADDRKDLRGKAAETRAAVAQSTEIGAEA